MRNDENLKITIIGLGNLMEEIFPCIRDTVGAENLEKQVNGTTADEADYQGKQKRLGIQVYLNDNLSALKSLEPDIIFFAPPPGIAEELINSDLKDYFKYQQQNSGPLPSIFAFPPVPKTEVYRNALGDDLLVLNVLPSGLRAIGGVPIQNATLTTTDHPWPEEEMEQARRIWAKLGGLFEVKPDQLLTILSGGVMAHATPEMVLLTADLIQKSGGSVDYTDIASRMRAARQQATGYKRADSTVCTTSCVPGALGLTLDGIITAWHQGIVEYMDGIDLEPGIAEFMMIVMLDMMLWLSQAETRETIERMTEIGATSGGVLEKAIKILNHDLKPVIQKALASATGPSIDNWQLKLVEKVKDAAVRVHQHGQTLNQS